MKQTTAIAPDRKGEEMWDHITPNIRRTLSGAVEQLEEIRPQLSDAPLTVADMVEQIIAHEVEFGDAYIAMEMGVAAGYISGVAGALRSTSEALLGALTQRVKTWKITVTSEEGDDESYELEVHLRWCLSHLSSQYSAPCG